MDLPDASVRQFPYVWVMSISVSAAAAQSFERLVRFGVTELFRTPEASFCRASVASVWGWAVFSHRKYYLLQLSVFAIVKSLLQFLWP